MLGLVSSTDPRWVTVALDDLGAVLVDHLHCELKAASNATALVARYPMHPRLVRELTELAREELTHVQQVFARLEARGLRATPPEEDVYARTLRRALDDGRGDPLLDRLSVAALIEARSCERFQILAEGCPDRDLAAFYGGLLASEARHHRVFLELARRIATVDAVRERLDELSEIEARVLFEAPASVRIHG